jgi:hypothetical protein
VPSCHPAAGHQSGTRAVGPAITRLPEIDLARSGAVAAAFTRAPPPPGCRFHPRCRYATEICAREEPPHEQAGFTACPEYQAAILGFYREHVCRLDPWPAG